MFDSFIANNLTGDTDFQSNISTNNLNAWKAKLKSEQKRIEQTLINLAFGQTKDKIIERHIQSYQNRLILLADLITTDLKEIKQNKFNKNLQLALLKIYVRDCLMELLTFIEQHFTKYFNQDSKLPRAYFYSSETSLKIDFLRLENLAKQKNLDEQFITVLAIPITEFSRSNSRSSYRQLIYCKTFLKEVLTVMNSKHVGFKLERELIQTLIYINFNSYLFYSYIGKKITTHYQLRSNYKDQLDCLQLFQKLINQSHVKPNFAYIQDTECIRTKLSKWLVEEIRYFTHKRQTEIQFTETMANDLKAGPEEKITCNLSVAQLAYGMNLLVNSKIIEPKSTAHLIDFAAQHLATKNQQEISKTSLRNKFYAVEASTVQYVSEMMERLLKMVETDKSKA